MSKYEDSWSDDDAGDLHSTCCEADVTFDDERDTYVCDACETPCEVDRSGFGTTHGFDALLVALIALLAPASAEAQSSELERQCPEGCIATEYTEECLRDAQDWRQLEQEAQTCEAKLNQCEGRTEALQRQLKMCQTSRAEVTQKARAAEKKADARHSTFKLIFSNIASVTGGGLIGYGLGQL